MEALDVRHLDLEVHAAAERMLERGGVEPAARSRGLLQHQPGTLELEHGEPLLGSRVGHRAADDGGVKSKRSVEVLDLELGNESCGHRGPAWFYGRSSPLILRANCSTTASVESSES